MWTEFVSHGMRSPSFAGSSNSPNGSYAGYQVRFT